uniref:Gustatory receptor n=1 Tax=Anopheles maculatus TaxID=74869 RepID=A0A182T6I0_9DIPT
MSACIRQNRVTFRIITAIYFVPATYNQTNNTFIEKPSNRVLFGVGLLLSLGYFYHDFCVQNVFFVDLAPFAFTIVLVELILFSSVPMVIVLNNFYHRKRMTKLLNILFIDDNLLDSSSIRMGRLRMEQLKVLFERMQREEEFEYFFEFFITRFERYVVQIDEINRCFAFPIITVFTLGLVELSYFTFECYHVITDGVPDREMYDGFEDWIISQFWQMLYCNFLLLVVSSCESTLKKPYFIINFR